MIVNKLAFYIKNYFICLGKIRKIKEKYRKSVIIVLGQPGIGDICFALAYVKHYLINIDNYVFICCKGKDFLLEEFGIKEYVTVSTDELEQFRLAYTKNSASMLYIFEAVKKREMVILDPEFYIKKSCSKIPYLRLLDIYKYAAFNLKNKMIDISFPCPKEKDNVVNKYGLKDNFAIINAYSNSAVIPIEVFELAVKILKESGLEVYSNISGDQKEINNTIPLRCSIQDMFYISRYCKCFVSIRSGILDYVISNIKNLFVVYSDDSDVFLYSLESWNCKVKLKELVYSGNENLESELRRFLDNICGALI